MFFSQVSRQRRFGSSLAKKRFSGITAGKTGLAAILSICAVAQAADGSIPVANSGFERKDTSGTVLGWSLDHEYSMGNFRFDIASESARFGTQSLTIVNRDPASAVVVSEPVTLRVGHLYRLSGWIRTKGVKSDPLAKYPTSVPACLTMESFPFTNHSPAVGGDSEWRQVETVFVATRSKDRVRLHLGHNGTAKGEAWFDEIKLEKVEDISELVPMQTLRWFGDGYRYDDRGWIFVHIEGQPYERGYQYGALLADEIAEYIRKLATQRNESHPSDGWRTFRFEADSIFLRGFDKEYLTEMKGIADGAAHAGAKFDERPLDLIDIVTINSAVDIGQLRRSLRVTPHSLTGESFLEAEEEMNIAVDEHNCSAFVATGPATADGQVVFGQIFMWSGYTGVHWNVLCDVQPSDGHRLVYHTFPGGIHSGADFYINSAGIIIGETTVSQTPFEPDSTPQSNRIRKAAQYASSIDDVERILWHKNNGMYTNDWPIADVKTGEVAILLLGTHRKKLWRTSETMSPFGTPGFLWANNNNRDPEVRKEYIAQPDDRPFDLVFSPWNRDVAFNRFYQKYKGKFDSTVAVNMWASSPINRAHACDGKITTTEMAKELVFLAHYGKVTLREKFPQKGYRIMPDLPGATPHLTHGYATVSPIFVTRKLKEARDAGKWSEAPEPVTENLELDQVIDDFSVDRKKLWRRTVYPATPAENWFVSASASYWRILSDLDDKDADEAAEQLSSELARLNNRYLYTVSRESDLVATDAQRAYDRYAPYRIPRIKGTFALHQLRLLLGTDAFLELMRELHDRFAQKNTSNDQLMAFVQDRADSTAVHLIRQWIGRKGLPRLNPVVQVEQAPDGAWNIKLTVTQEGTPYHLLTHLAVRKAALPSTDEVTELHRVEIDGAHTAITISVDAKPTEIVFNALHDIPVANPNFYVWSNLIDDFHKTLIVFGTARQDEANHTLARRWQETIANAYIEILPPLVKDSELTLAQASDHDLIVMGTLNDNAWFKGVQDVIGVRFGHNHFEWDGRVFGASDDGLFLVLPNPYNPNRVLYVVAANSALQLHQMTEKYIRNIPSWAIFKKGKIVSKGYHGVPEFRFVGPF